jgi:hypothetical protein
MTDDGDDIDNWIEAACDDGWNPANDGWDLLEIDDDPGAPPLTDDELKDVHERLAVLRSPGEFRQAVGDALKRCPRSEVFNKPKFKFLLDAWTLAEFIRHKPADRVRLAGPRERWPDGFVRIGQRTENVEVTVALSEGRKMGDEYKDGAEKAELDPVDKWAERADGIPAALEMAIEKKVAKRYGSDLWLVVYLDINEGGIRQREIEQAIAAIKERHAQSFGALFVIWKDKLL